MSEGNIRYPLRFISNNSTYNRTIKSRTFYFSGKRFFDIAVTLAAAPFALVVVGLVALLIRMNGGKAFYSQPRVGKGGRIFNLWKLRTMTPDADKRLEEFLASNPSAKAEWELKQKLEKDPRITWIGRYLRKYSIDELPQLLNVLAGDMSLVGPRPMLPEQRQHYPGTAYFNMRPGLTGLWQISERNDCSFVERALHDTRYSSMMCFTADLWIILLTPMVILKGTGL
jgi:exopolysaccharide production protein ExoY